MRRFDDFDAWGDAINGASLRMACDGVETRSWALGAVDLGGVMLQVAEEGGGNICYGANSHSGTILFMPLTHATDHVVNGERLEDETLLAIPRGADFRIHIRQWAHAWCSIALPFDAPGFEPHAPAGIAGRGAAVPRLRHVATSMATSLLDRPAGTPAHLAAGKELAAAAVACLTDVPSWLPAVGRPRLDRAEIIRRSMAVLDAVTIVPEAADLAKAVGVTSRTLLRTFQEAFGISPKRYLMLRALHAVRRRLLDCCREDTTVADVLTRHGIWEFGRFADRYRRQFGELPSETLRRVRAR